MEFNMSDTKPTQTLPAAPIADEGKSLLLNRRNWLKGATLLATPALSSLVSGCGGAEAAQVAATADSTTTTSSVTITSEPYAVAIVAKEASAALDINVGIAKLISLLAEAKAGGAKLMVCGELWLPGYPVNLNFQSDWKATNWANYVANSVTVGDANWLKILAAVKDAGLYLSFGFSELDGNHAYMAQALIGPDGTMVYKRRKVRPSGGERAYWSDAPMASNLQAVTTELGRITMLECWDHLRPQSTFNVMAQLPNVHICAWPYIPANSATTQWWERSEVAHTGAAYFSQLTGAFTLLAGVGHVGVYRNSVKLAELTADAADNMLFYTVTPNNWSGATGSSTSEFSYGVLQLLMNSYPGDKVADGEHGVLTMNPLS